MPSASTIVASLVDDAERYAPALLCAVCPLKEECGGLHCKASPLGCEEFCCGNPVGCSTVCQKHPNFLAQMAEVGGFKLDHVSSSPASSILLEQKIAPLIYHGSKRTQPFGYDLVALRLGDLIDFPGQRARFLTRAQLNDAFHLTENSSLLVTGVDHDPRIEPIWALHSARQGVFEQLSELGIACATTPNFSMLLDVPRPDNLHAMQRIAILYSEMSDAGLPTALHVNGRTEHDFARWGQFLRNNPSIPAISYEFITGSGLKSRMHKHVHWLNQLLDYAERPLTCVIRGNPHALDLLDDRYDVVYIETTSFVKSVKRQSSIRIGNSLLKWSTNRRGGEDISQHLHSNFGEVRATLAARYPRLSGGM